jgi:phosphoglucosamine mutase
VARLFGTDGVRGEANTEVSPEFALRLGRAVARVLREEGEPRPEVVVGHDPRWSSPMLEAALASGLASAGADVRLLGMVTTPVVAHATATTAASAGAMISASHNPMPDNGIKFFGHDGFKLTDAEEDRVEELLHGPDDDGAGRPLGDRVGRILPDAAPIAAWQDDVVAAGSDLGGMVVVVDAANGSASALGPEVYRRLGAKVVALHAAPDGRNINRDCGSTHPESLMEAVVAQGADVGIAHDGDADRLVAVDHLGNEVDGDEILAVLARDAHLRGVLPHDTVATTVMTNLGFLRAMADLGIGVEITRVGDRYVMEAMRAKGLTLGGEQSGHLISLDHATTGDGILSAVMLLATMAQRGTSLAELRGVMTRLPQVLVNVAGVDKHRLADASHVEAVVADVTARLGDDGRVLVRPSGTEPLIRVMVEAVTEPRARAAAEEIATAVRTTLSLA